MQVDGIHQISCSLCRSWFFKPSTVSRGCKGQASDNSHPKDFTNKNFTRFSVGQVLGLEEGTASLAGCVSPKAPYWIFRIGNAGPKPLKVGWGESGIRFFFSLKLHR